MIRDYKYEMQLKAEEIAEERYGREFYSLPYRLQYEVFQSAIEKWTDDRVNDEEESE